MVDRKEESDGKIRTHTVRGPRDAWKTWRRGRSTTAVSNPKDIPADEWLSPVKPAEVIAQERREAQEKAGVGTHASRTAAGMERAKERAKK